MIRNYLKIAWRNLRKDRLFTVLNLVGLSTGLACTLLIYLWVNDELNVDKYNIKDSQLYQVMNNMHSERGITTGTNTPGLLANALASELPEVEHAAVIFPASWFSNKGVAIAGEKNFRASGEYVSKDYFSLFTTPFISGDAADISKDKMSIALSKDLAIKLFNTTDHINGKIIQWNNGELSGNFHVVGVFENNPSNATNRFDALFNFEFIADKRTSVRTWNNSDPHTFVLLKKGTDLAKFNEKIAGFVKTKDPKTGYELFAVKYSERYLHGQFENGKPAGGRIAYVRLFTIIAVFIVIIACINFMNLSTAKASRRIKEVGIQKVVGARRISLIFQYLGESVLMALLALLLAIGLVILLLPAFNAITGKEIILSFDLPIVFSALAITLITGLIAGSYPALYLSSFKPATTLKGNFKSSIGELWVRKGLVVFQFTLSVIFTVSVLVVYRQINFIQSTNLGYNRDHVIHFEIPIEMDSAKLRAAASFVSETRNIPGVLSAGSYYHNLTGEHGSIGGFGWPGKGAAKDINFANLEVGDHFLETAGMEITAGRNFSPDERAQNEIVFNQAAILAMGLKDPIGKWVTFWDQKRQIVGVAKNFHFESFYEPIKPAFFQVYPVMPNVMVRIKTGSEKNTIAQIEKLFQSYNKGLLFDYQFLDENYQALYASERRVSVLSRVFAGLAIVISCLGLFGLAAFTAQRRQKEIGIRKVVGATVSNLVVMLSKDFVKLVLLAVLVAFPTAWWINHQWLNTFAYRVPVGADIFLMAGISTLLITIVTISFQAVKAALANPTKSLRSE